VRDKLPTFPDKSFPNKLGRTIKWISIAFEDNEFKSNKALNDQGKDEGTIIVIAQLNLNMSWSLTW
jgi:hypothetical protein